MKKNCLPRLIALMVATVMICLCCAGCGKSQDLTGTWTATLDMTESMKASLTEEMSGAGIADNLKAEDLFDLTRLNAVMEWQMVINKDGSMTMSIDGQKLVDSLKDVMTDSEPKIREAIPVIMESIFTQQGMTMEDVEAALAAQGMTMDGLVDEMFNEITASLNGDDGGTYSTVQDCYYAVDGDKLYILDEKNDKPNPDDYLQFELKGNEMAVTDMPDVLTDAFAELEEMTGGKLVPVTFTRS